MCHGLIHKGMANCIVRDEIHIPSLRPLLQQLIGLSVLLLLITFFKERLLFTVPEFLGPGKFQACKCIYIVFGRSNTNQNVIMSY